MPNPNPNDDTEFNDVLRAKGILPPKEPEVTEEDIEDLVTQAIRQRTEGKAAEDRTLEELDEIEDELDDRAFEEFRQKRIAELKHQASRERFGSLVQISESQYNEEVNKAGPGIWVVLVLFQSGIPACNVILQRLNVLAQKIKTTKFLKIVATEAIHNYPERNCPTLLIYHEGNLKRQIVGIASLGGMNVTVEDLEWQLKKVGAVESQMEEAPRGNIPVHDVMNLANALLGDDDE